LAAAALVTALVLVRAVLLPFLLAAVLTYLLNPPVTYLAHRGVARPWAILLIYGAFGGLIGGLLVWLVPALLRELDSLAQAIPGFTRALQELTRNLQADYSRIPLPESLRAALDDTLQGLEVRFIGLLNTGIESLVNLLPLLLHVVIAPVLAFYMLCDLERFREGFIRLLPKEYRSQLLALGREINEVVYGYIMGQVTVALVEGTLVGLVMLALGLEFALLVAFFYAVAELIPYFGPIIGAIPAVAAALLVSPAAVVKLLAALLLIQQLEASVLAPYFVGGRLRLHPLVVIFALLVGGRFYGVAGLLLSVPLAALLRVLGRFALRMLDREREGILPTRRPRLTKVRSWRIVNTKIPQPLARPEPGRGRIACQNGVEGNE